MKKTKKEDDILDKLIPQQFTNIYQYWSKVSFKTKMIMLAVVFMKYSVQILSVLSILYYIFRYSWILSLFYFYYQIFKKPKPKEKEN